MEPWDFGPETDRTSAIKGILRRKVFKPITKEFRKNYLPVMMYAEGYIMSHTTETQVLYAYVSKAKEYCHIPEWLYNTIIHKDTITYIIGPWVFLNGFEKTLEGKYLIKIFAY